MKLEYYLERKDFFDILKSILDLIDYKIENENTNRILKDFNLYSETDLDGNIVEVSNSLCELTGYSKSESIGQNHSILKHPNDDYIKYQDLWKTITNGKSWSGELQINSKYGETIRYKTVIFPKIDNRGRIIGYGAKRQNISSK